MFEIKIVTESYINNDFVPVVSSTTSRGPYEDFHEAMSRAAKIGFAIYCKMDDRDDTKHCFVDWVKRPTWDPREHYRKMQIGTVRWFNTTRFEKIRVYLARGKD